MARADDRSDRPDPDEPVDPTERGQSGDSGESEDPRAGWGPDGPIRGPGSGPAGDPIDGSIDGPIGRPPNSGGPDPLGAGSPEATDPAPRRQGFLRRMFGGGAPRPQPEPLDPEEEAELLRRLADPTGVLEYAIDRGWTTIPDPPPPALPVRRGRNSAPRTGDQPDQPGQPDEPEPSAGLIESPQRDEAKRLLATMPNYPGKDYTAMRVISGRSDPHLDSLAAAISGLQPAEAGPSSDIPMGLDQSGLGGSWDVLAFETTYDDGRWREVHSAVTAVPVLIPLPGLRLMPTRFPMRRAGGMLVIPSDDDEFNARWRLLATEDTPAIRALAGPTVRAALLSSPDLDEIWAAEGHLMASRLDLLSPPLLRWHVALLAAMLDELRQSLGAD